MKVYVAARFSDREEVKRINKLLIKKGHALSGDWTDHIQIKPYSKEPNRSKNYAIEDMNGVIGADIFILLTSENAGAGSSTELGAAIALFSTMKKPKTYVVGKHRENNMFNFHSSIEFRKSIEDVLIEL